MQWNIYCLKDNLPCLKLRAPFWSCYYPVGGRNGNCFFLCLLTPWRGNYAASNKEFNSPLQSTITVRSTFRMLFIFALTFLTHNYWNLHLFKRFFAFLPHGLFHFSRIPYTNRWPSSSRLLYLTLEQNYFATKMNRKWNLLLSYWKKNHLKTRSKTQLRSYVSLNILITTGGVCMQLDR